MATLTRSEEESCECKSDEQRNIAANTPLDLIGGACNLEGLIYEHPISPR